MKKLLGILGALSTIASTGATVVACGTTPADKGGETSGDSLNLGQIDNIYTPTILAAIKAKNSKLDISKLEVFSYDSTSAKIVYKKGQAPSSAEAAFDVKFTIKPIEFSTQNTELVTNILAGKIDEAGEVDITTKVGDLTKEDISKKTIIDSIGRMNGTFLSEKDVEVSDVQEINGSLQVTVKSLNQDLLKGESVSFVINQDIKSETLFRNTDLGTIFLPKQIWDKKEEYFDGTNENIGSNTLVSYIYLFQNLGDRNPLFKYLAADIAEMGTAFAIVAGATKEVENNLFMDGAKINLSWNNDENSNALLSGLISNDAKDVSLQFKLAEENRMVFKNYWKEDSIKVSETAYKSKNKETISKEIYNQLNDEFKNAVSFDIFMRYTVLHFSETKPTIEMLPAGDYIYGLNASALLLLGSAITDEYKPAQEGEDGPGAFPGMIEPGPGYKFEVVK
ncbi:hypothetical protein SCHIN_v1c01730 [Spiroplasma chinense]|uniref:Lipoprotein n=1 Tax=Spiroplasma chinense TaxID=216932 RepID=A0A5B9Y336_9MOLU|nr:lipoprotein [Spiroplasma chinense]QEH61371.1 hypothetical protein SCHIN_v1c01730 [Spiroplasma chinense]